MSRLEVCFLCPLRLGHEGRERLFRKSVLLRKCPRLIDRIEPPRPRLEFVKARHNLLWNRVNDILAARGRDGVAFLIIFRYISMTVTQLECFYTVVRCRHFARAADSLGKTQPAITVHIQRLEGDLGVKLLERSHREVLLTPAGAILLPYAERILAETAEARMRMAEVRGGALGVVRVGVNPTIAAHFLPAVLKEFRSRFPGVRVLLHEESTTPLLAALLHSGEIDLSIALLPPRAPAVKQRTLFTEEFCLAVSLQHPLRAQLSVPLSCLKDEKFILYKTPGHNTREITLQSCRNAGFEPEVAFESEQAETIQYLVASNLGVTLLPEMVLRHRSGQDIAMIRIQPPTPYRTVVAAWRLGRYFSKSARQFVECAETVAPAWGSQTRTIVKSASSP